MTEASGSETTPQRRRRRWIDRSKQICGQVVEGLHTLWKHHLAPAWQKLKTAAAAELPPPPPDELIERQEALAPFTLPAQGYVFTFTVRAVFTWSAKGVRPELLSWYARYFMPDAIRRVKRVAAEQARAFPAHRAGELEVSLRRALDEQDRPPWHYRRGQVHVACRPDVSVRLDERVRQLLQPHSERLIDLECQNDLYTRRAQYAEQLNRRWAAIMDEFVDHPAPGEAGEAIKEELNRARRHLMEEEKAAAQWNQKLQRDRRRHEGFVDFLNAIDIIPQRSQARPDETSGQSEQPTATEGRPASDSG
ncbi:hypothetical protein ABZ807_10645 [Micromonospora sp. NPDC047548]|uniref:hypothetical protein n=1 Tax=Micromonospora sp. NPDC047548 TaxID=3155624 RepID=UPI0033E27BDB